MKTFKNKLNALVLKVIKIYNNKIIFLIYRFISILQGKTIVHFLHIGKTGGTSIKYALDYSSHGEKRKKIKKPFITNKYIIFCHRHSFKLKNTLKGEKYFFVVRDPIDRYISGFYERKRKGKPLGFQKWTDEEKEAFYNFKTPNQLAVSISHKDKVIRKKAIKAMNNIKHVNTSYWDWFGEPNYFLSRIGDLIFVINQKKLDYDFIKLKKILKIPDKNKLPKDNLNQRKSPSEHNKNLEPKAIENLNNWYLKDYEFIRLLKEKKFIDFEFNSFDS